MFGDTVGMHRLLNIRIVGCRGKIIILAQILK